MSAFHSIEELIKTLNRERLLLRDMFSKRKTLAFRYEQALELLEFREERLRYLIDRGVVRSEGEFVELEDTYMRFFEEVLRVNEEISVATVREYVNKLEENIDYYLSEDNERRRDGYLADIRRILRNIAQTTMRSVIDLKRNVDNTYKNEPNYLVKKKKLGNLDQKRNNIATLIRETEKLVDEKQPTFFSVAMDVRMRVLVADLRYCLNESYHNLIEIDRQIIDYLNLIEYQDGMLRKIRRLKYLRDQLTIEEFTNISEVMEDFNPVWLEPRPMYRTQLSFDYLASSDEAVDIIARVREKAARECGGVGIRRQTPGIDEKYLAQRKKAHDMIDMDQLCAAFVAQGRDLFSFLENYHFESEKSVDDLLVIFCQLVSQFYKQMRLGDGKAVAAGFEYPLIYPDLK